MTALLALDDQLVVGTAAKRVISVELDSGRERWGWDVGGDIHAGFYSHIQRRGREINAPAVAV